MAVSASTRLRPRLFYRASPARYFLLRRLFGWLMRLLYRYEVTGEDNLPQTGPVIIAVNHLHMLDPLVVCPAVKRQVVTLAAEKYINRWFIGNLLRAAGVIFVFRGEVDREALRNCLSVLSSDEVLAIAPEGTRSKTGAMQRAKPGIAYLALRTKATIVPIALSGVERLSDWLRLRRPACRVVIGRPFRLPPLAAKPTTEQLQELADQVMERIGLLLPENYRGVYAQRIAALESGQE